MVSATSLAEFGAVLREKRRAAGLTQRALAGAAGVDHTYVSKIEGGGLERPPSEETIRRMADAVGVGPEALLDASGRAVPVARSDVRAAAALLRDHADGGDPRIVALVGRLWAALDGKE